MGEESPTRWQKLAPDNFNADRSNCCPYDTAKCAKEAVHDKTAEELASEDPNEEGCNARSEGPESGHVEPPEAIAGQTYKRPADPLGHCILLVECYWVRLCINLQL